MSRLLVRWQGKDHVLSSHGYLDEPGSNPSRAKRIDLEELDAEQVSDLISESILYGVEKWKNVFVATHPTANRTPIEAPTTISVTGASPTATPSCNCQATPTRNACCAATEPSAQEVATPASSADKPQVVGSVCHCDASTAYNGHIHRRDGIFCLHDPEEDGSKCPARYDLPIVWQPYVRT